MHFGVEDEVLSDVHDLGCTVDILENFRLSSEPLGPVPFLHQLLVPEIPIDFAFGVDAAAWVAIVMPNTPNIFRGFDATAIDALEKYNAIIAQVTGWGFAVIGVPILIFLFFTLRRLLKGLEQLTGFKDDELMLPR